MLKKFRITVDGKPYTVTVEEIKEGDDTSALSATSTMAVTPLPAAPPMAAAPKPATTGADAITSPLGGIVKEVKVSVGQQIAEGDLVIVLEAMKMKTNIFSNLIGTISAVHVKPGDAVDSGQALVTIG